jgi:hypothetical protein
MPRHFMAVMYISNKLTWSSFFVVLVAESCITLVCDITINGSTLDTVCQSPLDQTPDPQIGTEQAAEDGLQVPHTIT